MVRITFSNYGTLEQMFIEEPEQDAIETFWGFYGSVDVPRNTGGIRIVSIGHAVDTSDSGGYLIGHCVQQAA